jgi:hypothetical protein
MWSKLQIRLVPIFSSLACYWIYFYGNWYLIC